MLTLSAFLGGGGLQGVVVEKTFKPLPLSHSLGMDGIYRLELRGAGGKISRQMVSQEVFAAYEVGDPFDDRATAQEIRRRRQARIAQEEEDKAGRLAAAAAQAQAKARAKVEARDSRMATLFRRRDMLPETEGF